MQTSGLLFVSIIAFAVGYGLNEARHSATLPLMGMSLPKSIALWFAIMAILGSFVAGLYWAKDVGAL